LKTTTEPLHFRKTAVFGRFSGAVCDVFFHAPGGGKLFDSRELGDCDFEEIW
jgi:hypothetical protein